MTLAIFFAIAAISLASAILVISQRNSVISALYLIVTLGSQAVLYFLLGATFIGVLQIIVYAGAIMVLFLFVIMLLNLKRDEFGPDRKKGQKILAYLFTIFLTVEILATIRLAFSDRGPSALNSPVFATGSPAVIARSLFIDYVYPFEIVSILLLVAILGVVVLARRKV